jgi:hypothetical protein
MEREERRTWQDGSCRVSHEGGVPDPQETHQHREVLPQGHLEEVRVHRVSSCKELFHKGETVLSGRVKSDVRLRPHTAEHTEKRPPTQSQKPKTLSALIPKSTAFGIAEL